MRSWAIFSWNSVSLSLAKKSSACSTESAQTSMIERPGGATGRVASSFLSVGVSDSPEHLYRDAPSVEWRCRLAGLVAAKGDGEDFRLEPAAVAGIAELRAHESLEPVAGELALAFLIKPLRGSGMTPSNGRVDFAQLARAPEGELDSPFARAPHQNVLEVFRQILVGRFQALTW